MTRVDGALVALVLNPCKSLVGAMWYTTCLLPHAIMSLSEAQKWAPGEREGRHDTRIRKSTYQIKAETL